VYLNATLRPQHGTRGNYKRRSKSVVGEMRWCNYYISARLVKWHGQYIHSSRLVVTCRPGGSRTRGRMVGPFETPRQIAVFTFSSFTATRLNIVRVSGHSTGLADTAAPHSSLETHDQYVRPPSHTAPASVAGCFNLSPPVCPTCCDRPFAPLPSPGHLPLTTVRV